MAQHDYVIDNSTGANVRADINSVLQAIASNNSGSSAPSTTYGLQSFANTTDSMLQLRNAANNAFVNLRKFDGTLPLPDGSASSPSLFFDDDTNTGLFSSAADTFNVATGGVERFRIDSSGHVLINTTQAFNSLNGRGNLVVGSGSGNEGITIFTGSSNQGGISFADGTSGSEAFVGQLEYNHSNDSFTFATAASERMRIASSGDVGIGTTSPAARLEVKDNSSNTFGTGIRLSQSHNTVFSEINSNFGGSMTLNAGEGSTAALMHFRVNNDEKMQLNASGNLLHGCNASPSSSVKGSAFKFNANQGQLALATNSTSQAVLIELFNPNGAVGDIRTSGSGIIINGTSDYRLKENAVAISDGITRLKTLKPYRFNFKADPTTTLDGFFAHEVTAVPEAVTGTKDEIATEDNDLRGFKKGDPIYQGIDQSKLVPLLVAAVQELIGKVEALEAA